MTDVGTYLLVPPEFTLEAFHGVAHSMLLQPEGPPTGTRNDDYCERWSGGDTVVEWLEVGRLKSCFVWFVSPEPEPTADYLADKLNAVSVSDLLKLASQPETQHDDLVYLLYRVAYMSPKPADDVIALFRHAFADPRPTIRRAALNGYMIRRWSQLWERVSEIESNDGDAEVRATARRVLDLGPAANSSDDQSLD